MMRFEINRKNIRQFKRPLILVTKKNDRDRVQVMIRVRVKVVVTFDFFG